MKVEYLSRVFPGEEGKPVDQAKGVKPLAHAMTQTKPELTTAQLRRFFQHCRALESKLRYGASWGDVRADFLRLDAAAADAFGKEPKKIPDLFYDFIRKNVAAVKDEKDFLKGFLPHFEAVVAFSSLYLQRARS